MVSLGQQFTDMEPRSLPLWNLSSHCSWIYRSRREEKECVCVGGVLVGTRVYKMEGVREKGRGRKEKECVCGGGF